MKGNEKLAPRMIVPIEGAPGSIMPSAIGAAAINLAPADLLSDHGGRVLTSVEVCPVYWGAFWVGATGAPRARRLNAFFSFIVASEHMDMLAEFSKPGRTISTGIRRNSVTVSTSEPGTATPPTGRLVTDAQIQAQLNAWIAAGTVPPVNANTLYCIFLPPGTVSALGTSRSCTAFCGYHNHINGSTFYAVMPFADCTGCRFDTIEHTLTEVASHELVEAITDPALNAWFRDSDGSEIGDIVNRQTAIFGGFMVQKEWSNSQQTGLVVPFGPWRHLGKIRGHGLEADFDCSGLPQGARSVSVGDVDGDGRAEVVVQIDAANSGSNDFWVMD